MTNKAEQPTITLLPCPFCGCEASREFFSTTIEPSWAIFCDGCHASAAQLPSKADAQSAWNTRTPSPAAQEPWIQEFIDVYIAPKDATHVAEFLQSKCRTTSLAAQDGLVEALNGVLPFVLNRYLECNGDKCRHPTCASCWGEDYATEQSDKADIALANAKTFLSVKKGDKS